MTVDEFRQSVKDALAAAGIVEIFVKGQPLPEGGFAVESQPDGSQFTIVVAELGA